LQDSVVFAMMEIQRDFRNLSMSNDSTENQFVDRDVAGSNSLHATEDERIDQAATSNYVPLNYISPEVLAFISEWESSRRKNITPAPSITMRDSFGCVVQLSAPPPKRFYRTIWRSMVRRLTQ
jgi:hypothetical protein